MSSYNYFLSEARINQLNIAFLNQFIILSQLECENLMKQKCFTKSLLKILSKIFSS